MRAAFPEATILRPSIVFGPEDIFFNRFANLARFLPALPLIGGGQHAIPAGVRGRCGRCHRDVYRKSGNARANLRARRARPCTRSAS